MKYSWIIFFGILFVSCNNSEARRPINKQKSSKKDFSIELNKQIRAAEEQRIQKYIERDTVLNYEYSPFGFAYAITKTSTKPQQEILKTSVLSFEKTVYTLDNQMVYPKEVIKSRLEGSNLITGIREGVKLMREDEEIKFIFSSFVAHGFHGDESKIGANTPIVVKIKLLNINN
ncbi:FKBP-type peptidyl-prolyl cis-trans isomerase [Wenyingzhuangia sp. 2_MG-2023]|uniref:FKBP-type peptidyl-prolyl cis-trans isomerase n=1 Tax=Wenyingzhuangia sp. 2_MG-2023 TaxID=3062639 RepID=UPI0026E15611|nr:hypothetical protein [Wenyingzhuangia sp. 2_MG-2023]MDO6738321.1 hypothetical protein [Wenyingzhuangia sp. 2_MG-2023]